MEALNEWIQWKFEFNLIFKIFKIFFKNLIDSNSTLISLELIFLKLKQFTDELSRNYVKLDLN